MRIDILKLKIHRLSYFFTTFLFITISLICIGFTSCVAYASEDTSTENSISFLQSYAKADEKLNVTVNTNTDKNFSVKWYVDGVYKTNGYSYTPKNNDLQKMITVQAVTENNELLCEKSMFFSKLPVIYINTENNEPVVSKNDYLDADMYVQGNDKYNVQNSTLYNGKTEIKGRGNSTWIHFPKKPYRLKLDKKTDLFGLGKNKHWNLLANYIDDSLMRNYISTDIAKHLGALNMDCVFVELVFNGEHVGNYLLIEHVRVDKERVDIFDWEGAAEDVAKDIAKNYNLSEDDEDDLTGYLEENMEWMTSDKITYKDDTYNISEKMLEDLPDANGGYLIEFDSNMDEVSSFYTKRQAPIMVKSPEFINTNSEAYANLQNYIQNFEETIYSDDHTYIFNGERLSMGDFCDMDSLVNFWLTSETLVNEIGFRSTYMYKDVDEKIVFGPIWDFDFSSASVAPFGSQSPTSWITKQRHWFDRIITEPYFAIKVRELFMENAEYYESLVEQNGILDALYDYLYEAGISNDEIWHYSRGFELDYIELKQWLTERINWMKAQFESDETALASFGCNVQGNDISLSSDALRVSSNNSYYLTDEDKEISLNVPSLDGVYGYNVYINGQYITTSALTDSVSSVVLDKALFTEDKDTKNVIVVRYTDESEKILSLDVLTVTFIDENTEFVTFTFVDGENTESVTLPKNEKLYLSVPDTINNNQLFSCWNDSSKSYLPATYITADKNRNFVAEKVVCSNDTDEHNFVKNEDYVCSVCGVTKADDTEYVDIRGCVFEQSSRYETKYKGYPTAPIISVIDGDKTLTEGVDYKISYKNNVTPGYATYKVTGLKSAGYYGEAELSFQIQPRSITRAKGSPNYINYYYNGNEIMPKFNLTYNDMRLVEGVDFKIIDIKDNIRVGTASVTIIGLGNYDGENTFEFDIRKEPVYYADITLSADEFVYSGKAHKPSVTVKHRTTDLPYVKGKDYTVKYEANTNAGKGKVIIDFIGNYEGTIIKYFTIKPQSQGLSVSLSKSSYAYTGQALKPSVTVKNSSSKTVPTSGYTVKYTANTSIGTATVKVVFKGNYSGTKTVKFKIVPGAVTNIKKQGYANSIKLTWNKATGATGYQVYKYDKKTDSYVRYSTVKANSVTVSGLNPGTTYKFKIRAISKGSTVYYGNFTAVIIASTLPKSTSIIYLNSLRKNNIIMNWKEVDSATGYQVYYSASKNGTYSKLTSTSNTNINLTNSKLKGGMTYYFKVRAYRKIDGTNYFGAFSDVKSIKIR